MKKPLTISELTQIINQSEFMLGSNAFYPLVPAIENHREFAARFATEPPAEGFHRDLWLAVRAEVSRRLGVQP